ncbi:hypothetical protein K8Z49_37760 [Actinomadura madurae]
MEARSSRSTIVIGAAAAALAAAAIVTTATDSGIRQDSATAIATPDHTA